MQRQEGEIMVFDQSWKHRKPKYREVSSRFLLSPTKSVPIDNGRNQSPNHNLLLSPIKQKPRSSSSSSSGNPNSNDSRKLKNMENNSGFIRGLWPSTTNTNPLKTQSPKLVRETLADHLGNDRLKDNEEHHKIQENYSDSTSSPMFLLRQKSCTEFTRFENDKRISKEKHKSSLFGSSIGYTAKFKFPGISSGSSSSSKSPKSDDHNDGFVPGRLSVDETVLIRKKNGGKKSDYLSDLRAESESSESEQNLYSSFGSPVTGKNYHSSSSAASYMAPTLSSRMSGVEIPSKYMQDYRRRSIDHSSPLKNQQIITSENSPKKSFIFKNGIKRSNSGFETTKWGSSPVRSAGSESSSNLKPPTSPSRVSSKGVGNLLSIGLELFKGKKNCSSPVGFLNLGENVHQLRLFHTRLVQWRYANAKAEISNKKTCKQVQNNLIHGWDVITRLQQSVRQKKLQIEKEKLEMKLNYILQSQIKALESWSHMEQEHVSSVNMIKDCLHSVVCRVPLIEGAKVEPESLSMVLRDASDFTASINLILSDFPLVANKTSGIFAELAELVTQEKLLLEECLELFEFISDLEIQERSLKSYLMQLKLRSEQQQQQMFV